MALRIQEEIQAKSLRPKLEAFFDLAGKKIAVLDRSWQAGNGSPVFTVAGKYTARGWTDWTQGFQYGAALLQFDATGDPAMLELGRRRTREFMAPHLTHFGVHDHGFNNISTYGNLLRLACEGKYQATAEEIQFYQLALKVSGAIQASRWTAIGDEKGYIYSFNGPHSLFIDTIRSLRSLAVSHLLGHYLTVEGDRRISLFSRLQQHLETTVRFNIYFGENRDAYDLPGRTVHEAIFNTNDGQFRCPSSQQGYSPFTTWTRGLAWAICGIAEQLEFIRHLTSVDAGVSAQPLLAELEEAALATADFYLANSCRDGIPMWDTGAPHLHRLDNFLETNSNPFNDWEPVDSSAAAIAAQGFCRLGKYFASRKKRSLAGKYWSAGLTVANTLLEAPYLSTNLKHQGLLLHSVYHRPRGWDHIAKGQRVPNGESSMWGDYHLMELALLLLRDSRGESWMQFFQPLNVPTK